MERSKLPHWLRRILPTPFAHIPTDQEHAERDGRLIRNIVQQHAEGSVMLAGGNFDPHENVLTEDENR